MIRDAEGQPLLIEAIAGKLEPEHGLQEVPLVSRGKEVGILIVAMQGGEHVAERINLLDFIMPTIAMAIDDALTFTALADYRTNLEKKVALRTEELEHARDEIAKSLEQLQAATAARERLFANINHELRTPLSLIRMVAESLPDREPQLSERSLQDLAAVDASVHRLLRMVDEILVMAAGGEHKLTLDRRAVDLARIVRDVAGSWRTACEDRGVGLALATPDALACWLDPVALERVLMNLVSNALKFTPVGGTIRITLTHAGDTACVEVADSGAGFEQEFLGRIFGRFEQGQAARPGIAHGSGIGLSLVKELVEAHGGRVTADNNASGGARVRVELPLDSPAEAVSVETLERPRLRPSDYGIDVKTGPGRTLLEPPQAAEATVLLAEDDFELRERTGEYLSQWFRVLLAPDGIVALDLAAQHLPDILVTDIGMPRMEGSELTRRFRELPGNRLAPVIMLTAFGALKDRLQGFDAGAVDYVMKPFSLEELAARVRSQLQLRQLALKLADSERLASLNVMSTGLAHELRNPANAMLNAIEPLKLLLPKELLAPGSPTAALLDVLTLTSEQIVQVSRQLLGLRGTAAETFAEELFSNVIDRALKLFALTPRYLPVALDCPVDRKLWCSPPLLTQVLINLLENGAQASGKDGRLSLATRNEGESLVVAISDSGPGVPAELRARIFEPFFTTRRPTGSGLGLALAREIVERHGGALRLADAVAHRGATFEIVLPPGRR
jgi:signal transduction histidine kinase